MELIYLGKMRNYQRFIWIQLYFSTIRSRIKIDAHAKNKLRSTIL